MQQPKKLPSLRVLQGDRVRGTTCFAAHEMYNVNCLLQSCRHWLPGVKNSCVMIEALEGEHTQHEIGKMFGLSRMRICQIEKQIYAKIRQES